MPAQFTKQFTQQEPIPEEGIAAALAVMRHGRLHRYNLLDGELGETALLEQDFAEMTGAKFCVAVASGGYAISTALRALNIGYGDTVLTNAFTLAPVPGAIAAVGAVPEFVGVTPCLVIDLNDLKAKINKGRVLLLSHMRGHICDMDELVDICRDANVKIIEDCAHSMGASWNNTPSGRHGDIGCYSCQTYKHINSGEGGLLITDDCDIAARTILLTGSYMLYDRHAASPPLDVFDKFKFVTPNVSGRMDNLRSAILRPQLRSLSTKIGYWNALYYRVETGLRNIFGLDVIERPEKEQFVGSSIQFLLLDWSSKQIEDVVKRCGHRGVELKWFGAAEPMGFTSKYHDWQYAPTMRMPSSDRILDGLLDMRLPLTFDFDDCDLITEIIRDEVTAVYTQN